MAIRTSEGGVACLSVAAILAATLASGCSTPSQNFSQAPGFRKYYALHPPLKTIPTASQRALLKRYRPRIFVPKSASGPISFYRDYIAHGTLYDGDGKAISSHVTQALLNKYKKNPHVVFVYRPPKHPTRHPVVFARIDHDTLPVAEKAAQRRYTFLTYNVVFPVSGLPAGMSGFLRGLANIVGNAHDWHQLDPYNAVTIALTRHGGKGRLRPVAAIFQQHNYLRTYLLGRHAAPGALVLPSDSRIAVDVAIGSNELYPHRSGRAKHRAVPGFGPKAVKYLITGKDKPFISADDITDPAREVRYRLGFLAPTDAFYTFQSWLGARRSLPGGDGPPGADYNVPPGLKPKAVQMVVFYWYEGDRGYPQLLRTLFSASRRSSSPRRAVSPKHRSQRALKLLKPFVARFLAGLKRLRQRKAGDSDDGAMNETLLLFF